MNTCYYPFTVKEAQKTEHTIQTSATEQKHNANTAPTQLDVLLFRRSLCLARVLRAEALQNLSCEFLLAVLNPGVCSGQLEAFLPQHDPYFIPWGGGVHRNLVGRGVEEPGARVPTRLAVFYSAWESPRRVRKEKKKMEVQHPVTRAGETTHRLAHPCTKKGYRSRRWAPRQA